MAGLARMKDATTKDSAIDWRNILVAYIDHVGMQEGVDFIDGGLASLSAADNEALLAAAQEAFLRSK